ncbi:MAG TPA: hypothetical protein VMV49_17535, partial [Candidatus Deferrimicrobium sp.]|nr:hypothetical protein [Candidatus Deferrimicrobium sp.]
MNHRNIRNKLGIIFFIILFGLAIIVIEVQSSQPLVVESIDERGDIQLHTEFEIIKGDEIPVNTYNFTAQVFLSVAAFPDGSFVVAWQSYGQDGSDYGV